MASTLLEDAETSQASGPEPVQLRCRRDYTLVADALTDRATVLKKLAKDATVEGYAREGRAIQSDADAIEQEILPEFQEQRELPIVTDEDLRREVEGALRVAIYRAFDGLDDPKVEPVPAAVRQRRDTLIEQLVTGVTVFAESLARYAYSQGTSERYRTAPALTMQCIEALRITG